MSSRDAAALVERLRSADGASWLLRLQEQQLLEWEDAVARHLGVNATNAHREVLTSRHRLVDWLVDPSKKADGAAWVDEERAKEILHAWPSPVVVAMALDDFPDGRDLTDLRRSHQRQIVAAAERLVGHSGLSDRLAEAAYPGSSSTRGITSLFNARWGRDGGTGAAWLTALDQVIADAVAPAERPVTPWAASLHHDTAKPLSTGLPAAVEEYLRDALAMNAGLDGAWHAPADLVADGRAADGHYDEGGFIRPIKVDRSRRRLRDWWRRTSEPGTTWDEWITVGDGAEAQRVLVLADPGYGKSTLARWEAASRAKQTLTAGRVPKEGVPVTMSFRQLGRLARSAEREGIERAQDLPTLIVDALGRIGAPPGFPEWVAANQPRCCVILDAFDELDTPTDRFDAPLRDVGQFGKVIITSRPISRPPEHAVKSYETVDLLPLTSDQIDLLITRWFETGPLSQRAERRRSAQRVREALASTPELAELARIPLFAVLLCTVTDPARVDPLSEGFPRHRLQMGVRVPRSRAELLWAVCIDRLYGVGVEGGYGMEGVSLEESLRDAAAIAETFHRMPVDHPVTQAALQRRVAYDFGAHPARLVPRLLTAVEDRGGSGLLTVQPGTTSSAVGEDVTSDRIEWLHLQVSEYLRAHHLGWLTDHERDRAMAVAFQREERQVLLMLAEEHARLGRLPAEISRLQAADDPTGHLRAVAALMTEAVPSEPGTAIRDQLERDLADTLDWAAEPTATGPRDIQLHDYVAFVTKMVFNGRRVGLISSTAKERERRTKWRPRTRLTGHEQLDGISDDLIGSILWDPSAAHQALEDRIAAEQWDDPSLVALCTLAGHLGPGAILRLARLADEGKVDPSFLEYPDPLTAGVATLDGWIRKRLAWLREHVCSCRSPHDHAWKCPDAADRLLPPLRVIRAHLTLPLSLPANAAVSAALAATGIPEHLTLTGYKLQPTRARGIGPPAP